MRCRFAFPLLPFALFAVVAAPAGAQTVRDTAPDRWVATDALGRTLPDFKQVGPPRARRWVGMFYFLWLGEHGSAGPYDITEILKQDPDAMTKPDSPLWGGMGVPHHWGKSVFGYYRSDDPYVLRKHAQMLSDAGVDTVFFDVTNNLTYPRSYHALCEVWSQVRREGGRTPQIAFLCPFGDATPVVEALYDDLYEPGRYADLWFRWQGKPLILANPDLMQPERLSLSQRVPGLLGVGQTYGQTFTASAPFVGVGGAFPTYASTTSGMTLSLYQGGKPGGKRLLRRTFTSVRDNATVLLEAARPLPPGTYYLEMSAPQGQIGWWSQTGDRYTGGQAWTDGTAGPGDRELYLRTASTSEVMPQLASGSGLTPAQAEARAKAIRDFFTFRRPQPDYFAGQTAPDQWGWLEVSPQKPFGKTTGNRPEQVPVGVAQNAVDSKLSVLSNPRAHGRSYHNGMEPPPGERDFTGRNFAEQWERALALDPDLVFVTGWNEWIAGRFGPEPFYGSGPVSFVDQFNPEFSRDIEPAASAHTDDYYYQLVAAVRRYKGVRAPLPPAPPVLGITVDGRFADWAHVTRPGSVFLDDVGDTAWRDHASWNVKERYVNRTGRNDFTVLKVAHDARNVYFYARTRHAIQAANTPGAMQLSVTVNGKTWRVTDGKSLLKGGMRTMRGNEMEVAVPRSLFGLVTARDFTLSFKWRDNVGNLADPLNLYRNGDTAPNGRFAYVYRGTATAR